ncbi:type II toxin-antitoxin system Phd/YefM family antitoxin [Myceligenerans crystallogenes]|uniref:Antitoxin n=1 Tax=Myceligenerans crystallogenes TaxID=316335 RepID=A0ABN2NL68_9MICO
MSVVTASQFNQKPSEVKALSEHEPVFVTDRGHTTTVVLSIAEYERLRNPQKGISLFDMIAPADVEDDGDLEIHRDRSLGRIPDLGD